MTDCYHPPNPNLWTGRNSEDGRYWHSEVKFWDMRTPYNASFSQKSVALIGYPCDSGAVMNKGRSGAKSGPEYIRKQLGKLPYREDKACTLVDTGDIRKEGELTKDIQIEFSNRLTTLLSSGFLPLAIGGTHDLAYPHYLGIHQHLPRYETIGIINLDAHLDLRENRSFGHSGTPFYQVSKFCESNNLPFHYACIGARRDANTSLLWERAESLGALIIECESLGRYAADAMSLLASYIARVDKIYLTIDLDGFSSAVAPGVSASSPMGFGLNEILPVIDLVLDSGKLISCDIVEMNPKYDIDNQTAKLAASLIHRIAHY